ncbi:MAG: hypothetical protein KH989_12570 [Kocuria rhizophila]|nr:hypothetical protein [Kocuria rhizophila]
MAANSTTLTAPGTISPKVFWPVLVGLALTFVGSFLAAVTPDMLTGLGAFAVPMSMALTAVAQGITAYLKTDQLRNIGVEATAAVLPAPPVALPPVDETAADVPVEDAPDTAGDLQAELDTLHRDIRG